MKGSVKRCCLIFVLLPMLTLGCSAPAIHGTHESASTLHLHHANHTTAREITIHTTIPANNTVSFPNNFGIIYYHNSKKYIAIFNGSYPFTKAYTPATMVFRDGVLLKLKIGNKTYVPFKVAVQVKPFSWKVLYRRK